MPLRAAQRKRDVLPSIEVRKQRITLRQIAYGTVLWRHATERLAVRRSQAGNRAQQQRFAFAAGTEQHREAFDIEGGMQGDGAFDAVIDTHQIKRLRRTARPRINGSGMATRKN